MPKFLAFTLFSVAAAMSPKALAARRCVHLYLWGRHLSFGANNFNRLRVGAFPLAAGGVGTGGCRGRREGGPRLTPPATHAHRRRFAAAAPSVPSPRTLAWV